MKKIIFIVTIGFMTLFVLFFSQNHYFEYEEPEIGFGTEIALTVNGSNTTTFPKKESNLKIKNISCTEGIGYWDYSSWSLRVKNVKNTRVKCNIDFVNEYHETLLNGADPVLKDNLIPVTIENDGTVKRAKLGSEWYSYEKKIWANAIILEDESKTYYEGEIIPESNIESYFVWIPKYQYKLFNLDKYSNTDSNHYDKKQVIEVKFGLTNTVDSSSECKTPMTNGASGNCSVGKYMTHPAFLSIPSNGMWVGKFTTGYKGATTKIEAMQNENNSQKIMVKPNQFIWLGIQLANAHLSSYSYQRNLDSHSIKNTEWGAMAYLTYSKYGQGKNPRMNNNSELMTGYAATKEPTCGYTGKNEECNRFEATALNADGTYTKKYNSSTGYLASTTGNISGIYDTGGPISVFTMSTMADEKGIPVSGTNSKHNSGFNGIFGCPTCLNDTSGLTSLTNGINYPDSKYYDLYNYEGENHYNVSRRILGDATGELGPTYPLLISVYNRVVNSWGENLLEQFYSSTYPIGNRGYTSDGGTNSGILSFQGAYGDAGGQAFRVVLTP